MSARPGTRFGFPGAERNYRASSRNSPYGRILLLEAQDVGSSRRMLIRATLGSSLRGNPGTQGYALLRITLQDAPLHLGNGLRAGEEIG